MHKTLPQERRIIYDTNHALICHLIQPIINLLQSILFLKQQFFNCLTFAVRFKA